MRYDIVLILILRVCYTMQGSGGAFGCKAPPFRNVNLIDIYSRISSNYENIAALLAATANNKALGDLALGLGLVGATVQTLHTRVDYHIMALVDLGLGMGLVGVTVETLQTNLDALDSNLNGKLQTLNGTITTLSGDIETRFKYHINALVGLGLGLGLVGATVETLQKSTDRALGDLGLGLGLVGATVETLKKITDRALGDLSLGLG